MSRQRSRGTNGILLKSAAILGVSIGCHTADSVDFDSYRPDKSGNTDVSDMFQEAVNQAAKTDQTLILSPGRYWLAKPVVIQCNDMTISSKVPASPATVRLQGYKTGPTQKDLLTPEAPAKPTAIFVVKKPSYHLTVAGLTFEHSVVGIEGFHAIACSKIQNCAFYNCDYGIKADPIQIVTISGCRFEYGKFGIRGRDGGQYVSPRPGTKGPRRNRSNLVNIYDCMFRNFSEYAVQIEGSPTNVRDCDFENSRGAIQLFDVYISNIVGCVFENNGGEDHPLISVAPFQLPEDHNGQLNIYGNQINLTGGTAIIHVAKGSKLHAHDNRACVAAGKGQVLVKAEAPGEHVKVENNIVRDPAIP